MSIKSGLKKIVEALGGSVTGKSIPGLLKDIIKANGGEPEGKNIPDLLGDISENVSGGDIVPEYTMNNGTITGYSFANLLTSVTVPEGVEAIADNVFKNCTALKTVVFPSTLQRIAISTFYGCTSIETLDFPPSVSKIDSSAFYGCTSLRSIVLRRETPGRLENSAFANCTSLKSITILSPYPPSLASSSVFSGIAPDAVIYVPSEAVETYKGYDVWKNYTILPISES